MTTRLLVEDTGARQEYLLDSAGEFVVQQVWDEKPHLDQIRKFYDPGAVYTPSRDMKHVAHIPMEMIDHWNAIYGVNVLDKDNAPLLRRLLNDPAFRVFRVDGGSRV